MENASPKPEETLPDGRPAIGPDGVDISLIRWMLSLTPAERLRVLQQQSRSIQWLRSLRPVVEVEATPAEEPASGPRLHPHEDARPREWERV